MIGVTITNEKLFYIKNMICVIFSVCDAWTMWCVHISPWICYLWGLHISLFLVCFFLSFFLVLYQSLVHPLTRVVVDHILKALESEAGGDVVPAVVQSEDTIVLYDHVLHWQWVHTWGWENTQTLNNISFEVRFQICLSHTCRFKKSPNSNHSCKLKSMSCSLCWVRVLTSLPRALPHQKGAHSVPR